MTNKNEPQCNRCRFWDTSEQDNPQAGRVDMGACRRRSPVIVLGQVPVALQADKYPEEAEDNATHAVWPVTREWDWCGDFAELLPGG